jgi:phosphopantothenoylcysteine decarboxylase/phosphopantothenate--cysteine ligase
MSSGATREPIDNVRFISNMSTGKTGSTIAKYLDEQGDEVIFLYGKGSEKPKLEHGQCIEFTSTENLEALLNKTLEREVFDAAIQMAAVSDYKVHKINGVEICNDSNKKIDSSSELKIEFKRNKKILPLIKSYSKNKNLMVVGFKLTSHADDKLINDKLKKVFTNEVDYIIHNDLGGISSEKHLATLYNRKEMQSSFGTKAEIAHGIHKLIHSRSTK